MKRELLLVDGVRFLFCLVFIADLRVQPPGHHFFVVGGVLLLVQGHVDVVLLEYLRLLNPLHFFLIFEVSKFHLSACNAKFARSIKSALGSQIRADNNSMVGD